MMLIQVIWAYKFGRYDDNGENGVWFGSGLYQVQGAVVVPVDQRYWYAPTLGMDGVE